MRIKILILLVLILILNISCGNYILYKIEPEEKVYGIDFRRFAEKNFLFSTEKYNDSHLLLGIISMEIYPGAEFKKSTTELVAVDEIFDEYKKAEVFRWFCDTLTIDDVLDKIYDLSIIYGGDAFVNFEIKNISKTIISITKSTPKGTTKKILKNPTKIEGYKISGNIIKRTK